MKKKLLKVIVITVLLIMIYTSMVNAASFTTTMTPSSSNVEASREFTVEIKIANIDAGEKGINAISGTLDYDEEVFETISESSFDKINGWKTTYNPDTKKITLIKSTFVKTEERVLQITFKAKSDVEDGTVGKIKFTDIKASNSETDIPTNDISTTITIGQDSNVNANTNTNNDIILKPTNNVVNNTVPQENEVNNTNTTVPSYVNKENPSNDNMPHTGAEDTIVYFLGAAIILAMVFYIKFERVNKEIR